MKILIKNRDYGFFTTKPISVTKTEDGLIVYCNHEGAIVDVYEYPTGQTETQELCDKCDAWRAVGESEWHDAPFEGES